MRPTPQLEKFIARSLLRKVVLEKQSKLIRLSVGRWTMSSLQVPMSQVFVARWVGLNRLRAMVGALLDVVAFVPLSLAASLVVFRTGSGVRTPRVALPVAMAGSLLGRVRLRLRTVATVKSISRTLVMVFVNWTMLLGLFSWCWFASRQLRETFTKAPLSLPGLVSSSFGCWWATFVPWFGRVA